MMKDLSLMEMLLGDQCEDRAWKIAVRLQEPRVSKKFATSLEEMTELELDNLLDRLQKVFDRLQEMHADQEQRSDNHRPYTGYYFNYGVVVIREKGIEPVWRAMQQRFGWVNAVELYLTKPEDCQTFIADKMSVRAKASAREEVVKDYYEAKQRLARKPGVKAAQEQMLKLAELIALLS